MKKYIILILLSLLVTACAPKEEEPIVEPDVSVEVSDQEPEEEPEPEPVDTTLRSLLTHEETELDLSKKRPLAVMIENTSMCLPHYGLSEAGIVYEAPAEGGITRYMALYDSYEDFERLGNVRSARPYYIYIAMEYNAIYAHVGESTDAYAILKEGVVDELNGMLDIKAYFRSSDRKMPHNAYISSEGMYKDFERYGIATEVEESIGSHFIFAKEENLLSEGEDINTIILYYFHNHPYFIYNDESKTYLRYAFGSKEPDALSSDGTISFTNIILQDVDSKVVGKEGQLEIPVTGKGSGLFFTRGKMAEITWEKKSESEITRYFMKDGTEIELNTGKTYIGLVENDYKDRNEYLLAVN